MEKSNRTVHVILASETQLKQTNVFTPYCNTLQHTATHCNTLQVKQESIGRTLLCTVWSSKSIRTLVDDSFYDLKKMVLYSSPHVETLLGTQKYGS